MNPFQRVVLSFCSAVVFLVAVAAAEPIRLFYSVGPTTFEVKLFNNGLPVLDTPVSVDIERHRFEGDWSYIGDLPVDPEFMSMVTHYNIGKSPKLYTNRDDPSAYRVRFRFPEDLKGKAKFRDGDLAVFGWLVDQELRSVEVVPLEESQRINTELHLAGMKIDPGGKLVVWLIDEAGELKPFDKGNENVVDRLRLAALNGDVDVLSQMIDENPKLLKYKDKNDRTLMMYAANGGRSNVVEYLIEKGADPFDEDKSMTNVLDIAGEGGWMDIVKVIATGNAKNSKQKLHYSLGALNAYNNGHQEIAMYLMDLGARLNIDKKSAPGSVLALLANERVELARWVQEKYKVKGTYAENGVNFMHAVAGYADAELLEAVKAGGASVTMVSSKGITPLLVACGVGNRNAICWLMENGGATEESENYDPVLYAIRKGAPESVSCLIDYGVSVNKEEREGISPLMLAVSLGEKEISETLLEAGGLWLFESKYNHYSLRKAIRLNSSLLMEGLFEQGLSPDYTFPSGIGLDEFAAFYDSDEILKLLERRSSDTEIKLVGTKELAVKPEFSYRTAIEYPIDLQEKYGDVDVSLKVGIASSGDIVAVEIGEEVPDEIRTSVESTILAWKFKALEMDDSQLLAEMKFKIPLRISFREEDVFTINNVHELPRAVYQVDPNYPFSLKMAQVGGFVELDWVIDAEGVVRRPKVVTSTHQAFNAPAIESVKRSKWEPAKVDGKPVAVRVTQRMVFNP